MTTKAKDDSFLMSLEAGVKKILDNDKSKPGDRLKACEIGVKVLMVRHRIENIGDGDNGSFFGKS